MYPRSRRASVEIVHRACLALSEQLTFGGLELLAHAPDTRCEGQTISGLGARDGIGAALANGIGELCDALVDKLFERFNTLRLRGIVRNKFAQPVERSLHASVEVVDVGELRGITGENERATRGNRPRVHGGRFFNVSQDVVGVLNPVQRRLG
jgi:hypothetical protein